MTPRLRDRAARARSAPSRPYRRDRGSPSAPAIAFVGSSSITSWISAIRGGSASPRVVGVVELAVEDIDQLAPLLACPCTGARVRSARRHRRLIATARARHVTIAAWRVVELIFSSAATAREQRAPLTGILAHSACLRITPRSSGQSWPSSVEARERRGRAPDVVGFDGSTRASAVRRDRTRGVRRAAGP